MPSGFLVLPDGRCFAKRWSAHDAVLRAVADQLAVDPASGELHRWLVEQLPGPDDEEEIGYGAWARRSDGQVIVRYLDLRLMTPENQRPFCRAAKNAAPPADAEDWLRSCLEDLADMVARYERGEPPLSKSDWREVVPPEGGPIGPGWSAAEPGAAPDRRGM
jgi:hypothetical protein